MPDVAGSLDLGKTSAKYANRDELLVLMRQIVGENNTSRRSECVKAWIDRLDDHDDYEVLLREVKTYVGNALWQRCVVRDDGDPKPRPSTVRKAKDAIAAEVALWTWALPTTGKPLCDCTFQEVAEAAPLVGWFLGKLAAVGAPGTLVKEVFKDQAALQAFWLTAQTDAA